MLLLYIVSKVVEITKSAAAVEE
ncbi:Protein of unknown function [Bacillus mycoides]|nr:Protein of unknown function [Bacillus mycoides]